MESAGRAQPVRSGLALGSGAIRLGWQAGQPTEPDVFLLPLNQTV